VFGFRAYLKTSIIIESLDKISSRIYCNVFCFILLVICIPSGFELIIERIIYRVSE